MLPERGIDVSRKTARRGTARFGPQIARNLRCQQIRPGDARDLDDMVVGTAGKSFWLWRAVDHLTGAPPTAAPCRHLPRRVGVSPARATGARSRSRPLGASLAADHEAAARELTRACRPGGRLALIVWAPEGAVQEFLGIIGKYTPTAPPEPSPPAWGEPEHVQALRGCTRNAKTSLSSAAASDTATRVGGPGGTGRRWTGAGESPNVISFIQPGPTEGSFPKFLRLPRPEIPGDTS